MPDRSFKSKKALTCELILSGHQMSYGLYTQVPNLPTALGSLILHHSYVHFNCSVKVSARSPPSQVLKGRSTLAFGWLRATMSSALSSFIPWSSKTPQMRSTVPAGGERTSHPFITHLVSKKMQVQNHTFNSNFELTTSKGKQLPRATSLLYSLVMGGTGLGEENKTQGSHLLVEKNAKSPAGSFHLNL